MVGKGKDKWNGCVVENIGIGSSHVGASMVGLAVPRSRLGEISIGAGDYGIRDPRGSSGRDRHPCNHRFQAPSAGIVERHSRWNQQLVSLVAQDSGQSTVEFAVVTAGFLAATAALASLWHALGDGLLVQHALAVASHHIQAVAPVTIVDIFLY